MERTQAEPLATACPVAPAGAEAPPVPAGYYRCRFRAALIALGVTCVVLGAVGIVVPGLPTTPFLLVALWAFSKSSERFHIWLWHHRTFGPPLRNWHQHRVIPPNAKAAAVATMASSLAVIGLFVADSWVLTAAVAACMAPPAAFVLTRPSRPPG